MAIFEYKDLDLSGSAIRLVELCPAQNYHDEVKIKLLHTSLDLDPKYYALSYTWGAPYEGLPIGWDRAECTRPISINGKEHQIRLSLDSALRHLRQMEKDWTFIWIDAVSINQTNMQERSHQVQLMKAIYKGAQRTIIWLGPQTRDSGSAIRKISELAGSWNRRFQNEDEQYQFWADSKTKTQYPVLLREESGDDPAPWLALSKLFLHCWWRRAWIVQEASFSRSATIVCGFDSVTWTAMMTTCMILVEHSWQGKLRGFDSSGRTCITGSALLPLLQVLHLLRTSDATDPRVGHCYLSADSQLDDLLPSWIPDWRIPNKLMPLYKRSNSDNSQRIYSASGDTPLSFGVSNDLRLLSLRGVFVDTISVTGKRLNMYVSDQEIDVSYLENGRLAEMMSVTGQWADLVEVFYGRTRSEEDERSDQRLDVKYPPTNELLQDALQRTMFADIRLTRDQKYSGRLVDSFSSWDELDMDDPTYVATMMQAIIGRKIAISEKCFMGLVPEAAREGDAVYIFLGGELLYLVRKDINEASLLVGECYIHGLMDGEGLKAPRRAFEDIVLK